MRNFDPRIEAIKNFYILDSEEEEVYDEIVEAATNICETPIGIINIVDSNRQWFKAFQGIDFRETPIEVAICTHTINAPDSYMVIPDMTKDKRSRNNPFVTGEPFCRSYAGVCLQTKEGYNIGTLAVFDTVPRDYTEKHINCLQILARGTMRLIYEKALKSELLSRNKALTALSRNLETFNYSVAHDVKAPLINMASFSNLLLKRKQRQEYDPQELEMLTYIHDISQKLTRMVDNLLEISRHIQVDSSHFEFIDTESVLNNLIEQLIPLGSPVKITQATKLPSIFSSKAIFERIFSNLLSNSIKYADLEKEKPMINIQYQSSSDFHFFSIEDNGIGMSAERLDQVFSLFSRDHRYQESYGIGLTVAKELLAKINGEIHVSSEEGVGTKVEIKIPVV